MKALFFFLIGVICIFGAITSCDDKKQPCDCESNFDWVKKTIEVNDAGFQHIIDKKGQEAYNIHNQIITEKIKAAKTLTDCAELLSEWLMFFRSAHIGIELLTSEADLSTKNTDKKTIKTVKVDISQFNEYLYRKKIADYEGIWEIPGDIDKMEMKKMGIKKEGINYIGFIIESYNDKSHKVKMKIEQYGDSVKNIFYIHGHTTIEIEKPELIGKNYLQIGQSIFKRMNSTFTPDKLDLLVEKYFKSISSPFAYMEELNATTLYLRIPSFGIEYKYIIDKVLVDNKEKIMNTDNLIIDLRDNGGGSAPSFKELIPLLYTNPFRATNEEYLSSKLNNRIFLEYSYGKKHCGLYLGENSREWARAVYNKLARSRFGEFISFSDEPFHIIQIDTVFESPKNVGIIINKGCASATENFLFVAQQSDKVKLFGETTLGAFDTSTVTCVESPCMEFRLWYCMTRNMCISEYAIDDIGIHPDYYFDENIPQYEWVESVNEMLNQ